MGQIIIYPMDPIDFFMVIFIFLFGLCVGSFLNVVVYRVPKGESIVTGPSHCMTCGHRLAWYELIPVLSYVVQGGKCRQCGTPLSPQYPLVEAANGLAWIGIFLIKGFTFDTLIGFGLFSCLLALSIIDARTLEIPAGLNIFLACLGVFRIVTDLSHWYLYLIGGAAISVPLMIILLVTGGAGIGGGDVKLMAAAGLVLGWKGIIFAFFLACVLGAVIHLVRMKFFHAGRQLAMGPYLSAGILIAFLWGSDIISWYLGTMGL